ncbi:MAG: hypothetical protein IT262_13555 [Saprospiraceae bacterium]|nr:hypothetical protein [Saprospiraceae bacterium]
MKRLLLLVLLFSTRLEAQTFQPDLQDRSLWELWGRNMDNLTGNEKKGVSFQYEEPVALLVLKNYDFANGTIEFDTRGRDVVQRSFEGFAFHIQNDSTYDAVYFRPFNFKHPEAIRRAHSVQYISLPEHTWRKLRSDHPMQYENGVNPVPGAEDWFHVKIVVDHKNISVFVNNSEQPCLLVQKLTDTTHGRLGLWVGDPTEGDFANLRITPDKK